MNAALQDDARLVEVARLHWGLTDSGGSMHLDPSRHVLFQALPPARLAAIETARSQLLAGRARRPTPYVDRTQYAGWVALVASGFLAAARYAEHEQAGRWALRAVDRLLQDTAGEPVPRRIGDPTSPR